MQRFQEASIFLLCCWQQYLLLLWIKFIYSTWLKTLLRKNDFLSIFICKIHLVDTCTVILLMAINSTAVWVYRILHKCYWNSIATFCLYHRSLGLLRRFTTSLGMVKMQVWSIVKCKVERTLWSLGYTWSCCGPSTLATAVIRARLVASWKILESQPTMRRLVTHNLLIN